ncbi:FCS-Like Zinc finger 2 [Oryza sativa Japonica Group]|jgi:hypothetical protein|uniref:Os02g0687100 protein n=2 Tax=Oryza sativa subsp. japonica TaxID=39947 RepID=A0A0P0VN57_ORYSJ|nr:uncharacterized protein LOC107277113 [Oryza sativa Japonica Group]EAZ24222.1 hypothetical protein OsJ_07971 [Oryza sativa Japonica Group]KAF2946405.1 hypothetical protein DAI22_02g291200 [Oryza sativa Japonica Group]BAD07583.1 hypothetical protein [Oryza sativa Japonica Group]BAS80344.1 Os02g0687100 [Oryza sativa Japonica Group]
MEDYFYFSATLELEPVGNLESVSPSPSPRRTTSRDVDVAGELRGRHHHYLDACFLCGRMLAGNKDIFMYRGDTPFCSEECRQRQIDADDASEMMKKRAKMQPAAARGEQQPQRRQSPHGIPVWAR